MSRSKKDARKRLTDQEILEWFLQKFTSQRPLTEERKGFWKGVLAGGFLGGPFLTFLPFITWFEIIPSWYLCVPISINAILLTIWATSFYLIFVRLERAMPNQPERLIHFIGMAAFLYLSWIGLYGSLMALLSSIGSFVRIQRNSWWILVLIYGMSGIGLWLARKALLRAIVEGPEAHPWFWPIRLFFALSVGFCIFLSAILRIFLNWVEQLNVNIALLLLTALLLGLSILFIGFTLIAGLIGYLHYQRWRGVKGLKI